MNNCWTISQLLPCLLAASVLALDGNLVEYKKSPHEDMHKTCICIMLTSFAMFASVRLDAGTVIAEERVHALSSVSTRS